MSSANRTGLAYVEEAVWGVHPGTQMKNIDFESEGLKFGADFVKSNSIDPSRQVKDLIQTGAQAGGDIGFELCALQYDDFLRSALFAAQWSGAGDGAAVNEITSGETVGTLDITIDITPGAGLTTMTFGALVNHSLVVGQYFNLSGANALNNGIYKVTAVTAQEITVTPDFGVSEVLDEIDAAVVSGSMIRNGLTMSSYAIEREHGDVSQFFGFLGMTINDMSLDVNEASILTGKFGFLGKNGSLAQTTSGTGTNVSADLTDKFNTSSNVANVTINGLPAPDCLIKQITIDLNNNLRGSSAVAVLGFCRVSEGECDITGKLSMYFLDNAMYDRYLASSPFSLSFTVKDAAGNGYIITLPKCKLSDDVINATGKNTDVLEDASYQALMGTDGYTIQIDRLTSVA